MLGNKLQDDKIFATVSLERLVPKDNFYRHLSSFLDLRFIYQQCKEFYGTTGRPSLDPVVFFKMTLYGYFENITSDRELVRRIGDSLAARYFVGYDLDEELPWHSTISRTRGLIGEQVFACLFTRIVEMCVAAGLVDGTHQSIDSTLVKANASLDSLERKTPELTVTEYIKQTTQEIHEEKQNTQDSPKNKACQQTRNKQYTSKTDPDSKVRRKPNALNNLYYTIHYAVDSRRVITDVMATTADRTDNLDLLPCVTRAKTRLKKLGLIIESVGTDKGYCSGENLRAIEAMHIIPYIPSRTYVNWTGKFENNQFIYHADKNVYVCPNGKELTHSTSDPQKKRHAYCAKKTDCQSCSLRQKCTTSKTGRKVIRSFYHDEYERLIVRMKQGAGRYAMKIRKITTEPLFAEAKENHGLRKFMTRGIDKARKNAYVIATVQNIKRLLKAFKKANNGQKARLSSSFICILTGYPTASVCFIFA